MHDFIHADYQHVLNNGFDDLVKSVREEINTQGLATVKGFIDGNFLMQMQEAVHEYLPHVYRNDKYNPLIGADLEGGPFHHLAFSGFLLKLANAILEPFNVLVESADLHAVVGILKGEKAQINSRAFHFDATYLTIAVPIIMPPPDVSGSGQFRIWPNVRAFSQSKIKDRFYWKLMKYGPVRNLFRNFTINFEVGNIYFFYGFRSFHGTDTLDPNLLRANCLINFGGPFFDLEKAKKRQFELAKSTNSPV